MSRWRFVAWQIVENDDVAGLQIGDKKPFDKGLEGIAINRAVEHHGRDHAGQPQAGNEGGRLPMVVRNAGNQPLAFRGAAAQARHVGRGPGLVNVDKTRRVEIGQLVEPLLPALYDVGALPLARMRRLFLSVKRCRSKKRHNVPMPTATPFSASFEVFTVSGRREWSLEEKARIVAESCATDETVKPPVDRRNRADGESPQVVKGVRDSGIPGDPITDPQLSAIGRESGLSKITVAEIVKRSREAMRLSKSLNVLSCPFYVGASTFVCGP